MTPSSSPPSRSIPIQSGISSGSRGYAQREEAIQREAAMADYVDYCFASRLVSGMQKRQSLTHDIALKYENQAVIDHIIATRRDAPDSAPSSPTSAGVFPTTSRNRFVTPFRRDSKEKLKGGVQFQEEEMIFDMEL